MKRTKKLLPLMIKRIAAALSALLMIPALAACKDAGGVTGTFDWDENVLVYASLNGAAACREAVDKFNSAHTDVQIEVRDYSGEGGLARLTTEILAGKIPDIIELVGMPYGQLAQKGYLEDLWPYIEGDPELGRGVVMEGPLRAAEINGGLYMAFPSVLINTLIGPERLVGDRYSWTVKDLQEAFAAMPEDSTITDYYADKRMMFDMMCTMTMDSYVDWEAGTCSFDSGSFRETLAFVNSFPDKVDWTPDSDGLAELRERRLSGRQMLWMNGFSALSDIPVLDDLFGGKTSFVGYPVGDGAVGSSFQSFHGVAISSVCRNKEAAWAYVRNSFLPRYTRSMLQKRLEGGAFYGFPINRADYELLMDLSVSSDVSLKGYNSFGEEMDLYPLSREDLARFKEFYSRIERFDMGDRKMQAFIYESCEPYFAGDKTLDETVELIQNRVRLYINEQR